MALYPENKHLRFFLTVIYLVLGILGAYLFFKYVLNWFLPFVIAFVIARLLEPLIRLLHKKFHIPKKLASVLCVLIFYSVVGYLLYFLTARIAGEIKAFFTMLPSYVQTLPDTLYAIRDDILRLFDKLPAEVGETVRNLFDNILKDITIPSSTIQSVAGKITNFAFSLPSALIFFIAMLVSTYFISSDYEGITEFIVAQFPEKWRDGLLRTQKHLFGTLGKWLRAIGILVLVTFCELFVGFSILRFDYAILLALVISLIDALPVFGVGTVLIPWGIYDLIIGNYYEALFIIAMYAVVTVVRNIIEPKIVGQQIGLHPLVTLIGIYVGYRIFGLIGMFLCPILIITLKQLQDWGYIHIWKYPGQAKKVGPEPGKEKPL